ncbi:uncharacterized protein N7500_010716 [Penicillium coprophilum]|uniref:uncharacterized protein n=1 Tax=Penicillium coprophilum TaxID=36646 RepID=UPI0023A70D84|nr:uncharacterized protein N7500_010716 [Penicillium coprophilum]KAJ5150527.1 hypothetical protein N7500_010716 [Penicillium coprophilum]
MTNLEQKSQVVTRRRKWAPKLKSGCMTCKIRRVKCDEEKPQCRRCVSTGRKCDGYAHLPFAEEGLRSSRNNYSSRQRLVQRDVIDPGSSFPLSGSHTSDEVTIRHMHHSEKTDGFPLHSCQNFPLTYSLAESWNTHFIPFVIDNFRLSFQMAKSIYSTFHDVLSKAEEKSALYQACNAVARAYMANISRTSKARSDRAKAYGFALMAIRSAIQDPYQCKSDNTLLAIWLLGLYELLLGSQNGTDLVATPGWHIHNQVLSELIRLRGPEQFTTRKGRNLFIIIFSNVQTQALMSGKGCKEASTWFLLFHKYCEPSEYAMLRACIFSHHCARICSRVRALVDTADLNEVLSNSPSILQDMEEVEQATQPLSHEKAVVGYVVDPPMTPYAGPKHVYPCYVGVNVLQGNFRMRLSYAVLEFLGYAWGSDELLDQSKGVADELGADTVQALIEKPREPSTPAVRAYLDFQRPMNGKSTLLFKHEDCGISILRFGFGET